MDDETLVFRSCVLPVWGSGVTLSVSVPHMPNILRCLTVTTTSSLMSTFRLFPLEILNFVPTSIYYNALANFPKTAFSLRMPVLPGTTLSLQQT